MILITLLPTLLYLLLLKAMDVFSMIKWQKLSSAILYGICSAFFALLTSRTYILLTGVSWEAVWISPLVEELVKAVPLLLIIVFTHRIAFLCEAMIYGAAVGAGFAMTENCLYLIYNPEMSFLSVIIRGFSTALLHLGCTALIASIALFIVGRVKMGKSRMLTLVLLAITPSWALHTLHNSMLFDLYLQTFVVVAGLLYLFYIIAQLNERKTVEWLDLSMTTHINLLSAFREGQLSETNAGKYLETIKERCDSIVFFDMIVYMQLYIELLIDAKSRVLLHEVGMDKTPTEEETASLKDKYIELKELEQRIPQLQRLLLRPILHYNKADYWALEQLVRSFA